ncbi:MAG TPA: hypothetical protein VG844_15805 [Terracidiphilus sp.]|nr:hypothetical protein [Terracidiphilus sp.]
MSEEAIAHLMAALSKSPQFSAPAHCPYYPHNGQANLQQSLAITPDAVPEPSFPRSQPAAVMYDSTASNGVRHLPAERGPPNSFIV